MSNSGIVVVCPIVIFTMSEGNIGTASSGNASTHINGVIGSDTIHINVSLG